MQTEIVNFVHPFDDWPLWTLLSFRDRTPSALTTGKSRINVDWFVYFFEKLYLFQNSNANPTTILFATASTLWCYKIRLTSPSFVKVKNSYFGHDYILLRRARRPAASVLRCASVMRWVTKNLLSQTSSCFGRHFKELEIINFGSPIS
jgi:hypothetical protein